jgi:hypothetical protein
MWWRVFTFLHFYRTNNIRLSLAYYYIVWSWVHFQKPCRYLSRTTAIITSSKTIILVENEQSDPYVCEMVFNMSSINFETAYRKIRTHFNIFLWIKSMHWLYLTIYNIMSFLFKSSICKLSNSNYFTAIATYIPQ